MLNRPFQSVAELGYVFSGTPWKNLDFVNPETGDNALLDVFCVREDNTLNAVMAGKVDLNTRQAPVLQAILVGADRNETATSTYPETPLTGTPSTGEAALLTQALVARTTGTGTRTGSTAQPLSNIADLVGRYNYPAGSNVAASNGQPYDGFGNDLTSSNYTGGTTSPNSLVQRYRESAVRALTNAGMAGTWNLLIDVIAQTGRYPSNMTASTGAAASFVVEGEKRYWLHVAIDRQSGTVIDQQLELVNE